MLSSIKNYLARQARKPSGWIGRTIFPRIFNKDNKGMEQFGLELMSPVTNDRILEIGFGNGRLISEMMPQINEGKVCGIDISDEMVSLTAKRNAQWIQKGKLEIQKASVADIPYPDNHFDKVFTCNTIYFWPDPRENAREIRRVLKRGGEFYCAMRMKERMVSLNSVIRDNRDVFQNLYEKREAKQLLREAGFREVRLHQQPQESENIYIVSGIK